MLKPIIHLDASSLKNIDCPAWFNYVNLRGLTPTVPSAAAEWGTALHKFAALLYNGSTYEDAYAAASQYFLMSKCEQDGTRTLGNLMVTLKDYYDKYGGSLDIFTPLRVEEKNAVELPFKLPYKVYDECDIILCGVVDAIGFSNKTLCFKDIKTTSKNLKPETFFASYHTDIQMIIYTWAIRNLGLVDRYIPAVIDGVFMRSKPFVLQRSEPIDFNEQIVSDVFAWVDDKCDDIAFRLRKKQWPMNFTNCEKFVKKCSFYGVCKNIGEHREGILERGFVTRVYDPETFGQQEKS